MKPPEPASPFALKLAFAALIGLGFCAAFFMKKTEQRLERPAPTSSSLLDATSPSIASSSSNESAPASSAIDPTLPVFAPPGSPRSSEDLVRASVGRWKNDENVVVEIDPIRPRIGARPPFHLVVALTDNKGKRLVFGCDFTDAETVKKPPDQSERTYRAWCGGDAKGKRSALGLTLDAGLSVSLMTDGAWVVTATGLAKQSAK